MKKRTMVNLLMVLSVLLQACQPFLGPQAAVPRVSTTIPAAVVNGPMSASDDGRVPGGDLGPAAQTTLPPQSPAPALTGALRYPVEVDQDGDAATNPNMAAPVPVVYIQSAAEQDSGFYTEVTLAVEVLPTDAKLNPAGVQVEFKLRHQASGTEAVRLARTDAWGAAFVKFELIQDGQYSYQAQAYGFGQTPTRTFSIDATSRY
ncbi:MAG: hypothetical protein HY326_01700, partial [Chloroflexi bacterium]|nr:hypothetical protein [Chloroflexota bacterium]